MLATDHIYVFRTPIMAEMHEDESLDFRDVARILKDIFGVENL